MNRHQTARRKRRRAARAMRSTRSTEGGSIASSRHRASSRSIFGPIARRPQWLHDLGQRGGVDNGCFLKVQTNANDDV
jgi:hypothetical protein